MDLTHKRDLQAVIKKIVGTKGDKAQLQREQLLLEQFVGILGLCGERNAMIKSRVLTPLGEFGKICCYE